MKQRQPVLFVVFLLQVSWCFLSAGQQRLTASIGLCEGFDSRNSPLAGGSVGAVWAFASRGCVRVHVCVWVGVCLCVLEAKLVSTYLVPLSLTQTLSHEPVLLHTGKIHLLNCCIGELSLWGGTWEAEEALGDTAYLIIVSSYKKWALWDKPANNRTTDNVFFIVTAAFCWINDPLLF